MDFTFNTKKAQMHESKNIEKVVETMLSIYHLNDAVREICCNDGSSGVGRLKTAAANQPTGVFKVFVLWKETLAQILRTFQVLKYAGHLHSRPSVINRLGKPNTIHR